MLVYIFSIELYINIVVESFWNECIYLLRIYNNSYFIFHNFYKGINLNALITTSVSKPLAGG